MISRTIHLNPKLYNILKTHLLETTKKHKQRKKIITDEILNNGLEEMLKPVYYKLSSIGYNYSDDSEIMEASLKYTLDTVLKNYPLHKKWTPFRTGILHSSSQVEEIDNLIGLDSVEYPQPYYEFQYAIENSLVTSNGVNHKLTSLGNLFISLSSLTAPVFILKLESYCHTTGTEDQWHISQEYLKSLNDQSSIYLDFGDSRYTLLELDPNLTYLRRLDDLGLMYTKDHTLERRMAENIDSSIPTFHIGDDFIEMGLTDLGRRVLSQVLDEDLGLLDRVIQDLIQLELSGKKNLALISNEDLNEILDLTIKFPKIILNEAQSIEDIITDVKKNNLSLHHLRGIMPSIEAIMRQILNNEGHLTEKDKKITLGGLTDRYRTLLKTTPIISKDILDFFNTLERNKLLHGTMAPSDQILEIYLGMALNFLLLILREYQQYKKSNIQ